MTKTRDDWEAQIGIDSTRPARSIGTPSFLPSGEAATLRPTK